MNQDRLMQKARKELERVIKRREAMLSRCDLGHHVERVMLLSDESLGHYCERCGKILKVELCEDVDWQEWLFSRANPEAYTHRSKRHELRMQKEMENRRAA